MSFERTLISQCAPTLASLKTGNLFSMAHTSIVALKSEISLWNNALKNKGITLCIMRHTKSTALIYVYRESALKSDLCKPDVRTYLRHHGYKLNNINETLSNLQVRLMHSDDFPHEIGLFLSYPIEDVTGFVCNNGANCNHCGYWKVYGDKTACLKKFKMYDKCRDVYLRLWGEGHSVLQLTVAL